MSKPVQFVCWYALIYTYMFEKHSMVMLINAELLLNYYAFFSGRTAVRKQVYVILSYEDKNIDCSRDISQRSCL